jgi:hypothetical protein
MPIPLPVEPESDGGSAHANPANGSDKTPAEIMPTNAFFIMFVLPSLSSRNDGDRRRTPLPQQESSLARGAANAVARHCNLARH